MLSKEEIYKANYMQLPCIMLTKENLDRLEEHCKRNIRYDAGKRFREHEIVLRLLDKYNQLETREQKLIDKLEEDIEKFNRKENVFMTQSSQINASLISYINEILSIVKGEKK